MQEGEKVQGFIQGDVGCGKTISSLSINVYNGRQ